MAEIPAFVRKCVARSESPFSVTTTSGLNLAICEHTPSIHSSSSRSSVALERNDRNTLCCSDLEVGKYRIGKERAHALRGTACAGFQRNLKRPRLYAPSRKCTMFR